MADESDTDSKVGCLMPAVSWLVAAHWLARSGDRAKEDDALRAAEKMLERARALL